MRNAYADTSAIVAVAFNQPNAADIAQRLNDFDRLTSANLLEAEMRAVYARENREFNGAVLSKFDWIYPARPLSYEFAAILGVGYLRGGDLWHVAVALYFYPDPTEVYFLSLDDRQRGVAEALGFQV